MNRDFFILLVFATHRVANRMQSKDAIKKAANELLSDLLLFTDENPVDIEQKKNILPRALRQIESVKELLSASKGENKLRPENFAVLEREYAKVAHMLVSYLENRKTPPLLLKEPRKTSLSLRQKKIVDVLSQKGKAQVWELQKILPEVTKRTLRRDLDDLLERKLVERQGEWNTVAYALVK